MTSKVAKRPIRSLSAHEKMDAIRRVHDGESKASVARDIGVPESTLRGWCKNEDKILYLSRQSTPETDDSDPPRDKKPRFESPTDQSRDKIPRYEPDPSRDIKSRFEADQPRDKKPRFESPVEPFNLSVKEEGSMLTSEAKSVPEQAALNLIKQESNRAELNRMSIELGLNRPEMFLPNSSLTEIASLDLVTQWSAIVQQMNKKRQHETATGSIASTVIAPATTTTKVSGSKPKKEVRSPPQPQQIPTGVDDSVWYWLKTQQAMLGLVQNSAQTPVDPNSSWFWKWYKQIAYGQLPQQPHSSSADKPILYQQLIKDTENHKSSEDLSKPAKVNTKARAVLDNLLLNNNNVVEEEDLRKDDKELSAPEALAHGEKFLRWLERCGDPSVTALQILQFRYLLNNVKTCVERKSGIGEHRAKVRSRK